MVKISKEWTPVERLKIIVIITDLIRDDVNMDRYGRFGRPNIQSVHELVSSTPEILEENRESIEKLVNAHQFAYKWNEKLPWE